MTVQFARGSTPTRQRASGSAYAAASSGSEVASSSIFSPRMPIGHIHILSASNLPPRDPGPLGLNDTFVVVKYEGVKMGETRPSREREEMHWDDIIHLDVPWAFGSAKDSGGTARKVGADDPPQAKTGARLELEVWHRSYSLKSEAPRAEDLYDDLLFDPARVTKAALKSAERRFLRAKAPQVHHGCMSVSDELVAQCTLGPLVLRNLAMEAEPVELRLWGTRGKRWRLQGILRARLSVARLQARLMGACGFPVQPGVNLSVDVKWQGRSICSRPLNWAEGFCLRPPENGSIVLLVYAPGGPKDASPDKVTSYLSRTLCLSTFDAEGLVDLLNCRSKKAAELGLNKLHELGFYWGWDAASGSFSLSNVMGRPFTLIGSQSSLATDLMGFSPRDHKSQCHLRRSDSAAGEVEASFDGEGQPPSHQLAIHAISSDLVPRPVQSPEWTHILWGPPTMDVVRMAGKLDVEVWEHRDVPDTIAQVLLGRPTRTLLGRVQLTAPEICTLARCGMEQRLPIPAVSNRPALLPFASTCATPQALDSTGEGGFFKFSSWRRGSIGNCSPAKNPMCTPVAEPSSVRMRWPWNEFVTPACDDGDSNDQFPTTVGTLFIAINLRDQSQVLLNALRRWTLIRDEKLVAKWKRSRAEAVVAARQWGMLLPTRTAWHWLADSFSALLLILYAFAIALRAFRGTRCARDYKCDPSSDPELLAAASWQDALDAVMTVLSLVDILVKFRTGYVDSDGSVVMNPGRVARRYLQTWFMLDALSCLPHDILPRLLGDDWFESEDMLLVKCTPETPLARLVWSMSKRLHWRGINNVRGTRLFREADKLFYDASLTRDYVVNIIAGRRTLLRELMGIPPPKRNRFQKFWNITRLTRRWVHRSFEYRLFAYVKFTGSLVRAVRLLGAALRLLPRMNRFVRLALVAVRNFTVRDRYTSEEAAIRLLQRRVRSNMEQRVAEKLRSHLKRSRHSRNAASLKLAAAALDDICKNGSDVGEATASALLSPSDGLGASKKRARMGDAPEASMP